MYYPLTPSTPPKHQAQIKANKFPSLATVNFFLGCVGVIQVSRILTYNYKQKKLGYKAGNQVETAKEAVEAAVQK